MKTTNVIALIVMYIGILISFPNAWHAAAVAITLVLFHKQILDEEQYLARALCDEYAEYENRVRRYL